MTLARVGVMAAALFAVATVAWAQKPDFSGTWTLDPASAPGAPNDFAVVRRAPSRTAHPGAA